MARAANGESEQETHDGVCYRKEPVTSRGMGETRWLDDLESRSWRGLLEVHSVLMARLDAELQQTQQISLADYEVLVHLSEADGHMLRMTELADRLLLSPSGLTRRVDRLVSSGLVERVRCPTDRRGILARLKTAGRKRLERAAPDHVDQVRRNFIDRLNRRQLASLVDALDEIVEDPVLSESRVPG